MDATGDLCGDDALAYERNRTRFAPDAGMPLDERYRLAHLPLIAPRHPRIIPAKPGTSYAMGRHPRAFSLVLPVPAEALEASPAYRTLEAELRAAPFAHKVAWSLLVRRRDKLHATLCGALGTEVPPTIEPAARRALEALGPIWVEARGLFSGDVNRGRLYLKLYPERRAGTNLFHAIQRALGRPTTDLYVVGIWNLTDDLDRAEAAALRDLVVHWWDRPVLRFALDRLWLLGACDDLVLDAAVSETILLDSAPA